jgi:hypothetical protein
MQIAARWVGGFGLVMVAAGASAALFVTAASRHEPNSKRWTEMTYRGYVTGRDYELPSDVKLRELHADEEALAACMDAWPGKLAIRPVPGLSGAHFVQVEEGTLLDQCLQVRHDRDTRFSQGVWSSPPAEATMNVPSHLGRARPRGFDDFRYERELEAAALAAGEIVAVSCPAQKHSTFEGLPSLKFRLALWHCRSHWDGPSQRDDWFHLTLDEEGVVTRVITPPQHLPEAPCVMAVACGRRFAGLGAGLWF